MAPIAIKDLNGLRRRSHKGLYKKGLALSKRDYNLVCDYLEKINYSLQDIERLLSAEPDNHVFVSIVVFVSWIQESMSEIKKCYQSYVFTDFRYDDERMSCDKKFFNAIRSFVFAHPMTTNRHDFFGFDGTLRCVDIRSVWERFFVFNRPDDKFYISRDGLKPYDGEHVDYWLYIYDDKKYDNEFKRYIGISLQSVCEIANDYVDYLYALDKHLSKINIQ